jgi:large subunit ribosomal protein L9
MRIILQKDVTNLGDAGDIKEVSPGYARNYLIPKKLAIIATDKSAKAVEFQKKLAQIKKENRKKSMLELAKQIEANTYTISVKVGENEKLFGSVTSLDIANSLKSNGIEIDKRKIEISEPIKSLGAYQVKVKLADGVQSTIKLNVEKLS